MSRNSVNTTRKNFNHFMTFIVKLLCVLVFLFCRAKCKCKLQRPTFGLCTNHKYYKNLYQFKYHLTPQYKHIYKMHETRVFVFFCSVLFLSLHYNCNGREITEDSIKMVPMHLLQSHQLTYLTQFTASDTNLWHFLNELKENQCTFYLVNFATM